MKEISKALGSVYCNEGAWERFRSHLQEINPSKLFVLVDAHTEMHCLPVFKEKVGGLNFELLRIPAGEPYKTIDTCVSVWNQLSSLGADRKSVLINLGGGVVTDLGGFVACTYQRGISFINIPTSLLAMVDASVGGKTGVDLGVLKNQIGIIRNPEAVIIDTDFLKTLPKEELISGMAEVIKHGFIHSEDYLQKAFTFNLEAPESNEDLIWESVLIKNAVISEDPTEKGVRKTLNFGHTLGHAIESYFLNQSDKKRLLHGEAIAIGMILALSISSELFDFPQDKRDSYSQKILALFPKVTIEAKDQKEIIKLLIFDKKNSHGKIRFVLLSAIGVHHLNCEVPNEVIKDSFKFYAGLVED